MTSRKQMCTKKVSFFTKAKANAVAVKFGQRVYECPICFCWHCTAKADWREEYIDEDEVKSRIAALECKMRTEFNEKMRIKNSKITELQRQIKNLKIGHDEPNEYSGEKK